MLISLYFHLQNHCVFAAYFYFWTRTICSFQICETCCTWLNKLSISIQTSFIRHTLQTLECIEQHLRNLSISNPSTIKATINPIVANQGLAIPWILYLSGRTRDFTRVADSINSVGRMGTRSCVLWRHRGWFSLGGGRSFPTIVHTSEISFQK